MPETATIVDELRAEFGAAVIDAAIAAGTAAQKRYAAWIASHGQEAADAWLMRQRFERGSFYASEGGRTVGVKRR